MEHPTYPFMHKKIDYILFALCIVVSVIWLSPQIRLSQPNLLDIAETWSFGTEVVHNTIREFTNLDRFRPIYALERTVLNALFFYQQHYYFLFFSVLLGSTLFLSITLAKHKTYSWYVYGLVCMIILVSPITVDTYWRLGTAENFFTLALMLSVYFIMHFRYIWATLWLIVLMFSKETAIFYIPIFLVLLYMKKKYVICTALGIGYTWFVFKAYRLIVFAQHTPGQYTSLFSASLESIQEMLVYYVTVNVYYVTLFAVSLGLFLYRTWNKRTQRDEWGYLYIALVGVGVGSLLFFHNKFQPYYMFPAVVMIVSFLALELNRASTKLRFAVIVYSLVLFVSLQVPLSAWERANFWQSDYVADGVLIGQIEKTIHLRKYTFTRPYRPELQPALDVLYAQHPYEKEAKQYTIYAADEGDNIAGVETLCGTTIIGIKVCKWSIAPVN